MNGLILTASRGAFLGLVGGGALLSMLHPARFRTRLVVLAMIAAVGFVAVADARFIERMYSLFAVWERSEEIDMSAESRFVIKAAQWKMFLDYPLGTGHRGTVVLSPMYMDEKWLARSYEGGQVVVGRSSHNTFFTALSEQGVVGVVLFSALVLWVMMAAMRIFRLRNRVGDATLPVIAAGLCGGVVVVLVAGIGTDYLMAEVQFWFLAGLVCALRMLAALAAGDGAQSIQAAAAPAGRPTGRLQAPQ